MFMFTSPGYQWMLFSAFSFLSFFCVKEIAHNKDCEEYCSKQSNECPFQPCRKSFIWSTLLNLYSKRKNAFKVPTKGFCFERERVGADRCSDAVHDKACGMFLVAFEFDVWFCRSNPSFSIFNEHMIFIANVARVLDIDWNDRRIFLAKDIGRVS